MTNVIATTDGTDETLSHISSEVAEELGKMDAARIFVPRDEFNASNIAEGESIISLGDSPATAFGGLLRDVVTRGTTIELIVDAYERFAQETQPSDSVSKFVDVDDENLIRRVLRDVPNVGSGDITTIESGLSFTFSHSSPAKQLREVAGVTQGELRYTPDGRVDYVQRVGNDRTGLTLSPDSNKLDGTFTVNRIGDRREYTHIRALGAGEGEYQLSSEAVSSSYSSGDRKKWGVVTNKSITDQTTLDVLAETLITESAEPYIEIDGTAVNEVVRLGDSFTINYPEKDINRELRAVAVETREMEDGVRYHCTFSNRQKTRFDIESKDRKDIERFNRSVQGGAVPINAVSGRRTVDSGIRARMKFYYPGDVITELRLNIRVAGLAYRDTSGGSVSETGDYPSNCNILVNGNSLDTSLGDGTGAFQESVDAVGMFNEGVINTVDIESDSLGDVQFLVEGDVYRQTFGDA